MKITRSLSIPRSRRTKRSMQYYRVWIHSCNGVLGITSAIFAIFAGFIVTDVRISLLGGVELYHPTFLYAYLALTLQLGVIQVIGFLGAKRLSHKLLSFYWNLLLVLTIGDCVVGLVWVFKLDKVKLNLRPLLTQEFISKYSTDESFTRTWNLVQKEEMCCGVDSPLDYDKLSSVQSKHSSNASLVIDVESSFLSLPESCCVNIYDPSFGRAFLDDLNETHSSPYHPSQVNLRGSTIPHQDDGGGGPGDWYDGWGHDVTDSMQRDNYKEDFHEAVLNDAPDSKDRDPLPGAILERNRVPSSQNGVESPGLVKHKMRHGNHRLKVLPQTEGLQQERNASIDNSVVNETSIESPVQGVSGSSGKGTIVNGKNKTKGRNKTQKLLPSFSFSSSKSLPNSNQRSSPTEADIVEKLPLPFTCHRHLESPTFRQGRNRIYQSNHNNKQHSSSGSKGEAGSEGLSMSSSTAFPFLGDSFDEVAGKDASNEIRNEGNNEHQQNFPQRQDLSLEGSEDAGREFGRRKRDSPPPDPSSSFLREDEDGKRGAGKSEEFGVLSPGNVFSFLHAPAFSHSEDDEEEEGSRNGNSLGDRGTRTHSENAATESQAAYYLSYLGYQNGSLNDSLAKRFQVYRHGCGVKLIAWVDHVAGILVLVGFCIVLFCKVFFLYMLRIELAEMIEKIRILELENPTSPSKGLNKERIVSLHPLLSSNHRASTVSAHAFNATLLPTIKSPEGSSMGQSRFPKTYQQRRHSNIIGDRSSTHSQETVNMTLMVGGGNSGAGPCAPGGCQDGKAEKGRSNPNLSNFFINRDDFDPISISVPNTAKYLRRSSTCSATAHSTTNYPYLFFDDPRPGPSSRFYHHETSHHHNMYHQHCHHGHHARPKLYQRNMSIGAVVHHSTGGGENRSPLASAAAATSAFRSSGGGSAGGSANCSFSSRDENEIISASAENVVLEESDDFEEKQKEAEIREWAAKVTPPEATSKNSGGISLAEYTKGGFNHSSDSGESNDRGTGRRNGNNNVDSIPIAYLGTAV